MNSDLTLYLFDPTLKPGLSSRLGPLSTAIATAVVAAPSATPTATPAGSISPIVFPPLHLLPPLNITPAGIIAKKYAELGGVSTLPSEHTSLLLLISTPASGLLTHWLTPRTQESGVLGHVQSTLLTAAGDVSYITYQSGGIYYHAGTGASAIYGNIYLKWVAAGGLNSNLGYPITDEFGDTDKNGVVCRHNDFHLGGSIWWTAVDGAHLLYGNIWLKWKALGGIKQGIGYPITDEADTPNHTARFNNFKYGAAIYWSTATPACVVMGVIYEKYMSVGGATGGLGIPTTDELSSGTHGGRFNDFTGGTIYFSPLTGAWPHFGTLPNELQFRTDIFFPGSTPVGGSTSVTLRSNGDCVFQVHMHDSGFPSYKYSVACGVKDAGNEVYTFTAQGHLCGTLDGDSRDDDFGPHTTNNADVAQEWRALVASAQQWTHTHVDWDIGALITEIVALIVKFYPVVVKVVTVVAAVV